MFHTDLRSLTASTVEGDDCMGMLCSWRNYVRSFELGNCHGLTLVDGDAVISLVWGRDLNWYGR